MRVVSATLGLASRSETQTSRTERTRVSYFDDRGAVSLEWSAESRERAVASDQRVSVLGTATATSSLPPAPRLTNESRRGSTAPPPTAARRQSSRPPALVAPPAGSARSAPGAPPAAPSEPSPADDLDEFLGSEASVQLFTLRVMLEKLTGRSIRVARRSDFELGDEQRARIDQATASARRLVAAEAPRARAPDRAGFGLEISSERRVERRETLAVRAAGVLLTDDGRQLAIDARFALERREVQLESSSLRLGDARLKDPLVLVFDGSTADLSQSVKLDLDADGELDELPFASGNAAFLVRDENGNGRVDDGSELFGALSGDGFADLAALDSDDSGFVDEGDAAFAQLYAWEGRTETGDRLVSLADRGVGALHVESVSSPYALRDESGALRGAVRQTGVFIEERAPGGSTGTDGGDTADGVGLLQQIDLVV
jgi:hypothetical protein